MFCISSLWHWHIPGCFSSLLHLWWLPVFPVSLGLSVEPFSVTPCWYFLQGYLLVLCARVVFLLRDCWLRPFCFTCILLSNQLFLVQPWCWASVIADTLPLVLCLKRLHCFIHMLFLPMFSFFLFQASLWTERRHNSEVTWQLLKQWPPDNKVHLIKVRDGEKWSFHCVTLKPPVCLALN